MKERSLKIKESTAKLTDMVKNGTSPYHVVAAASAQLAQAGFQKLKWDQNWELKKGNAYYLSPFKSCLIAFRVGEEFTGEALRMIISHVDSPALRLKAGAEYPCQGYARVNTEVYGGAIFHTWMDRPLGLAGIVAVRDKEGVKPRICYLDCRRPLFIIPNLPIHYNKEINKGVELNPQIDLIPLAGLVAGGAAGDAGRNVSTAGTDANPNMRESGADAGLNPEKVADNHFFTRFLIAEIERTEGIVINEADIISYDLGLYVVQEGMVCGLENELLAAPRLDNLTSVQAGISALIESERQNGLNMAVMFDHEEVGSRSKSGGGSNLLPFALEWIYTSLGLSHSDYLRAVAGGFLLSVDTAHAVNPNHPEKYDPTSGIRLGDGVAVKCTSRQSYAGDAETWAILKALAEKNKIPCRLTYTRSDIAGGSTLGPVLSATLPMQSADIGVPLLAMHSAVETISCADQYYLKEFLKVFLSEWQ